MNYACRACRSSLLRLQCSAAALASLCNVTGTCQRAFLAEEPNSGSKFGCSMIRTSNVPNPDLPVR